MSDKRTKVLPVNLIVLAVGLLDLATTLLWITGGCAVEINPVMAAVLRAGLPAFVMTKIATLLAYVVVMEWYRRRRSASFALLVGRVTLASYLAIYAFGFCCVNGGLVLG